MTNTALKEATKQIILDRNMGKDSYPFESVDQLLALTKQYARELLNEMEPDGIVSDYKFGFNDCKSMALKKIEES